MPPVSNPTADTNIPISSQLRDTPRIECAKRGAPSYDHLVHGELQLGLGDQFVQESLPRATPPVSNRTAGTGERSDSDTLSRSLTVTHGVEVMVSARLT